MYSERFRQFIEIWQRDFAIERSMNEKVCIDRDGKPLPWYTYPAIEYLSQFDYHDKIVFEFGAGSSSMYWAARARSVISVEDNPEWKHKLLHEFKADNWQLRYCESKDDYAAAVLADGAKYDVIIVDGKYRAACAANAVKCLAAGGIIILDDSDRVNTSDDYIAAVKILRAADLLQVDFYGFCPLNNFTKATSIFFSRDFAFKSVNPLQPCNGIGNIWSMSRKQRKEFFKKQDYPLPEDDE